jgi:hypothetical protein
MAGAYKKIYDKIPIEAGVVQWICEDLNVASVWYHMIILPINYTEEQNKIINSYENKFLEQNQKISYLSNLIQEFFNKDNFEKYFIKFNSKFEHSLAELESKIYLLQNEIKDVLNKSESIIRENIFYPGKIGYKCQFKDFHAFIDYVLDSIHQLGSYQNILKSYEI